MDQSSGPSGFRKFWGIVRGKTYCHNASGEGWAIRVTLRRFKPIAVEFWDRPAGTLTYNYSIFYINKDYYDKCFRNYSIS